MTLETIQNEWRQKYRTHTDLALEAHEVIVQHEGPPEIPGVAVETEETEYATISRVAIMNEQGSRAMGKMPGKYSTIEAPALRQRDRNVLQKIADLTAEEVRRFLAYLQVPAEGDVLVIGLGNWNATPDALGPRTVHHLVVTRHFYHMATPQGRQGVRPVAALSPGVLGITGIETAEIVRGLVQQIKPAAVVCVDALAARSTERLATTIQISDAGIQPGSGVGNKRFGITRETLGVPVIAIGVPTVVHALTVVADGLEKLGANGTASPGQTQTPAPAEAPLQPQQMPGGTAAAYAQHGYSGPTGGWPLPDPSLILRGTAASPTPGAPTQPTPLSTAPIAPSLGAPGGTGAPPPGTISSAQGGHAVAPGLKREIVHDLLEPYMGDLIMTPKEIDVLIDDVAETVAEALNEGLHDDLDLNRLILSAIRA